MGMAESTKVTLTLPDEALAVLDKHTSPRRRSEFISKLLIQYAAMDSGIEQVDVEAMKLQMLGIASTYKSQEARLLRLERQMGALLAQALTAQDGQGCITDTI